MIHLRLSFFLAFALLSLAAPAGALVNGCLSDPLGRPVADAWVPSR